MDRVLGLDSGGTRTRAIVVDRTGQITAQQETVGLDPTAGQDWEARLAELAKAAGPVQAAVLGLPFHGEIPAVSARQTAVSQSVFGPNCRVMNDVALAFEGAFAGGDGVLILAGTGSMAWARGPQGIHRVGGWGDAFGDEGSAHWIGREALTLVSHGLDGRARASSFTDQLLARIGTAPADLIGWTYSLPTPRAGIAAVATHVSALAQTGDPDAVALMTAAATHLAALGQTAARLSGAERWSFAGGVMQDPTVLATLTKAMARLPLQPILPPVGGAALAAATDAGWAVTPGFITRLRNALTKT